MVRVTTVNCGATQQISYENNCHWIMYPLPIFLPFGSSSVPLKLLEMTEPEVFKTASEGYKWLCTKSVP
jgi:hypothetical protein